MRRSVDLPANKMFPSRNRGEKNLGKERGSDFASQSSARILQLVLATSDKSARPLA
jgi:hypothetical protein